MLEDKDLDAELEKRALAKQEQKPLVSFEKPAEPAKNNAEAKDLVDKGIQAAVIHKLQN